MLDPDFVMPSVSDDEVDRYIARGLDLSPRSAPLTLHPPVHDVDSPLIHDIDTPTMRQIVDLTVEDSPAVVALTGSRLLAEQDKQEKVNWPHRIRGKLDRERFSDNWALYIMYMPLDIPDHDAIVMSGASVEELAGCLITLMEHILGPDPQSEFRPPTGVSIKAKPKCLAGFFALSRSYRV